MKWLYHAMLRRMEKRYSYDATYLHELTDAAPGAFRRFMKMQMAGKWRGPLPLEAFHAAGLAGTLHEDCGPCVQIGTDMALEAGVAPEVIAAMLSGTAEGDTRLALDFGRALLAGDDRLDELRAAAKAKWGEAGVAALSLTAMSARNFPVMKRAMGHAQACQRVRVGADMVAVVKEAA